MVSTHSDVTVSAAKVPTTNAAGIPISPFTRISMTNELGRYGVRVSVNIHVLLTITMMSDN